MLAMWWKKPGESDEKYNFWIGDHYFSRSKALILIFLEPERILANTVHKIRVRRGCYKAETMKIGVIRLIRIVQWVLPVQTNDS